MLSKQTMVKLINSSILLRYYYPSIWFHEKKKKLALRGKGKSRKESSLKLQSSDSSAGVKTF